MTAPGSPSSDRPSPGHRSGTGPGDAHHGLRRRTQPWWVQAGRGLALVTGLALAVGIVGLVFAWLATLLAG